MRGLDSRDWEAYYAFLHRGTFEAVADAVDLKGARRTQVARALNQRSPFGVRHYW